MIHKHGYPLLVIFLCAVIVINMFFLFYQASDPPPAPYDMGPRPGNFFPSFRIYYVEGEELHSVKRLIQTMRVSPVLNAISAYNMVAQETMYDRYGKLMIIDVIDVVEGEETIFLKVKPDGFKENHYTTENYYLYIMSLVNTITEVAPGKRVTFLFEDTVENPVLYSIDMNRLFSRDESVVLHSSAEVYEELELFLRALDRQNTNIAYQKILPEDRRYYNYSDFYPYAKAYNNLHLNEMPVDYRMSRTEEGYCVTIYYPDSSASPVEVWELQGVGESIYILMRSEAFEQFAEKKGD
ncbi:MAG: hypothetical protein GX260_01930 [Tissierellia bacterium]|nr:hypothetical protein [Bacillota bacterium]NLL22528.1 hypothetical protein [Tissierellia bacterium]